jgi:hypothetical protein
VSHEIGVVIGVVQPRGSHDLVDEFGVNPYRELVCSLAQRDGGDESAGAVGVVSLVGDGVGLEEVQ